MSDETFEDEPVVEPDLDDDLAPDDLVEDDIEDDDDLVVEAELDPLDLDAELTDEVVPEVVVAAAPAPSARKKGAAGEEEDDDVVDLDEELHPDDVETPLDALLKERTASAKMEDDEEELEEEEPESDDRLDGPTRIVPRRPTEFHCSSCFLLLPRSQLADEERMLCRDCA
jgi:Domain of unknown function (DUF4193)